MTETRISPNQSAVIDYKPDQFTISQSRIHTVETYPNALSVKGAFRAFTAILTQDHADAFEGRILSKAAIVKLQDALMTISGLLRPVTKYDIVDLPSIVGTTIQPDERGYKSIHPENELEVHITPLSFVISIGESTKLSLIGEINVHNGRLENTWIRIFAVPETLHIMAEAISPSPIWRNKWGTGTCDSRLALAQKLDLDNEKVWPGQPAPHGAS